ncbi:MAG: DUF4013 domain-containing protein [Anaerolineae bacterium]|nr:DUF4013 domain-containing protein [Anaerolineae bacterium]
MDFVKALTYPFDDEDWLKKLGIAVLLFFLNLIPVIGTFIMIFAVQGWQFEIVKRVKRDDPEPLPGWDNFGGLISKGLTLFLAGLVYFIPTILFSCIMLVPFGLMPALESEDAIAALGGLGTIGVMCCSCLIALYSIAAWIVYSGGLIRYVDKEEFGTFMEFGANIALVRDNLGDFGMVILFLLIGGVIASILSGTGIGALLTTAFSAYFTGHILGQLAHKLAAGTAPQV